MTNNEMPIATAQLRRLVEQAFARARLAEADARLVADVLVWGDASGHGSHGTMRAPRYLGLAARGELDLAARPQLAMDGGALFKVDGQRAAGAVAMARAVAEAAERARAHGIAFGAVADTTHIGPAGYHALALAERGLVGIVAASGIPLMAYFGTATPALSTAPIAIAVPIAGRAPMVLDMASSVAAFGKLRQAAEAGRAIPEGWALTAAGAPTTDPDAADVLLPLGGPKGAGLALMLECLTSILAGAPILEPMLAGRANTHKQAAFVIALDAARFGPQAAFEGEVLALAEAIEAQPRAPGFDEILMPGARSARERERHRASGTVMLPAALIAQLTALAG